MACGLIPVPVAVKVSRLLPLPLSFTSTVQLLLPVELGVNFTITVWLVLLLTLTGMVGETIENWEQSGAARSTTVTNTFVLPPALSVVFIVLDWLTTTLPKSIGAVVLKAACATPLLPIHTPNSNNANQRFDIAMPLRPRRQFLDRNLRGAYNGREATGKRPTSAHLHPSAARSAAGNGPTRRVLAVYRSAMTETPSGLKFEDAVVGTGASPTSGQTCVMHYTGWLWVNGAKGSKFDSSVDRGRPFEFPIGRGRVIKGWDEGVASMKIGGKRTLLIPPSLGYGDRGAGGVIPPGATLLFEVELIGVR
jgi:peptidylprolyl isomerase